MVPGTFFTPCEAMGFLLTGVRLAAGAIFYIPEIVRKRIKSEGES
jgi:hypothetical protein